MTVTMKDGGIYRDRMGHLHGPVRPRQHPFFRWQTDQCSWDEFGRVNGAGSTDHRCDLIEELTLVKPLSPVPRANWAEAGALLRDLVTMGYGNTVSSIVSKGYAVAIPEDGQELLHAAAVQAIKQRLSQLGVEVE